MSLDKHGNEKTKTEAPTSGQTKTAQDIAKDKQGKLTMAQFDFINIAHMHHRTTGEFIGREVAKESYGIEGRQYDAMLKADIVIKALEERNVSVPVVYEASEHWRSLSLTAEQIIVADTMLDMTDTRSNRKKLQDLNVKSAKWAAWLRDPAFAEYLDKNVNQLLKNSQHDAAMALMDKVNAGDLKAIEYYHEYTGRFIRKPQAGTGSTAEANDIKRVLQGVVEIIVEEVDDHEIAARIADRLKTLMTATNVVNQLTSTEAVEIVQPEVIPNRVLTPAQQKTGMEI